jgi:hypothetical protein
VQDFYRLYPVFGLLLPHKTLKAGLSAGTITHNYEKNYKYRIICDGAATPITS